jgi:hypothetical protein
MQVAQLCHVPYAATEYCICRQADKPPSTMFMAPRSARFCLEVVDVSEHSRSPCTCQGREEIQEDDLFTALEKIQQERLGGSMNSSQSTDETVRIAWDRISQWCATVQHGEASS